MSGIKAGDIVLVRDAHGRELRKRALGPVVAGGSFDVVWACREEEWGAAQAEGREAQGLPWPAEDVSLVEEARVSA
jgi:hypothetical protein